MGNGDGVLDDMYLILQRRVGHEGDVGQEQQLLNALDLKHSHMRQRIAGAQTDFLVQHALEEGLGVQQALHVHVGHAVVGQLDGLEGGLHLVRLVDDLIVGEVDVQLGCDLADGSLIADQNGVGNALLVGGVDSSRTASSSAAATASFCLPQVFTFAIRSSKFILQHLVLLLSKGGAALKKAPYVKIITRYAPWVKRGKGSAASKNIFRLFFAFSVSAYI